MHITVYGGAGYCGSQLVERLLRKNYRVRVVDNGQRNNCDALLSFITSPLIEFVYGNINDKHIFQNTTKDTDIIVFLSGCVGMPVTTKYTAYSNLVNIGGVENLVANTNKDIPIIFASSGSVYGALKEDCTENSPTNPQSPYGIQKLEGEKLLLNRGNVTCFRFSTAFGVSRNMRLDLLPNELVYNAVKCKSLTIFEEHAYRTFLHVNDYSDSIIYAIENWGKFKDKVFNVGSEKNNRTKRELAELIKEKTGCSVFYADSGYKDIDARNYYVKFDLLESTGFKCNISIENGIDELIKATPLLDIGNSRYRDKLL